MTHRAGYSWISIGRFHSCPLLHEAWFLATVEGLEEIRTVTRRVYWPISFDHEKIPDFEIYRKKHSNDRNESMYYVFFTLIKRTHQDHAMPCHWFFFMTSGVGASISYQAAPDPSEAQRIRVSVQRWSDHSMVADVGWKTGCDMVWYHPTSSVNLVFNHLTMIQMDKHQCRYPLPPRAFR